VAAADEGGGDGVGASAGSAAVAAASASASTKRGEHGQQQQQQQQSAAAADAAAEEGAADDYDPPGPCPICGLREIAVPYAALPCRHVFCYYCLRAHCEADAAFECPVDGRRVAAMRRFDGRCEEEAGAAARRR
jgi:peroxin-2